MNSQFLHTHWSENIGNRPSQHPCFTEKMGEAASFDTEDEAKDHISFVESFFSFHENTRRIVFPVYEKTLFKYRLKGW